MAEICVGKGIVVGIKFTFRSFGCKTVGNCVYNETSEKQRSLSSFIIWGTLHLNWWDDNLLVVLVVLWVGKTPIATRIRLDL